MAAPVAGSMTVIVVPDAEFTHRPSTNACCRRSNAQFASDGICPEAFKAVLIVVPRRKADRVSSRRILTAGRGKDKPLLGLFRIS